MDNDRVTFGQFAKRYLSIFWTKPMCFVAWPAAIILTAVFAVIDREFGLPRYWHGYILLGAAVLSVSATMFLAVFAMCCWLIRAARLRRTGRRRPRRS